MCTTPDVNDQPLTLYDHLNLGHLVNAVVIRYGNWTDIDYAVAKTRESYGYNNVVGVFLTYGE